MKPKILSLGFVVPQFSANQTEAMQYLGFKSGLTRKIFEATGIERRYAYFDPRRYLSEPSWQDMCDEYAKGVVEMGVKAVDDALDEYDRQEIGNITFVSVTGYTCPSPSYAIAGRLGLRSDIVHTNIIGEGCEAAIPGLERAYDYTLRTGAKSLMVSVELCSCTYFPTTNERDIEYVVSASIFGDGATAAVVGFSNDDQYPEIHDFESHFDPQYLDLLGYKWEDGRLKVVLSRDVPDIVPPLIAQTVDKMLERNRLRREDISHWILHPGGRAVLENLEHELGLEHGQAYWSWEVMKRFGNMSSSTIGAIAKYIQKHDSPRGWGVAASMGAGTAVNTLLCHWG